METPLLFREREPEIYHMLAHLEKDPPSRKCCLDGHEVSCLRVMTLQDRADSHNVFLGYLRTVLDSMLNKHPRNQAMVRLRCYLESFELR